MRKTFSIPLQHVLSNNSRCVIYKADIISNFVFSFKREFKTVQFTSNVNESFQYFSLLLRVLLQRARIFSWNEFLLSPKTELLLHLQLIKIYELCVSIFHSYLIIAQQIERTYCISFVVSCYFVISGELLLLVTWSQLFCYELLQGIQRGVCFY